MLVEHPLPALGFLLRPLGLRREIPPLRLPGQALQPRIQVQLLVQPPPLPPPQLPPLSRLLLPLLWAAVLPTPTPRFPQARVLQWLLASQLIQVIMLEHNKLLLVLLMEQRTGTLSCSTTILLARITDRFHWSGMIQSPRLLKSQLIPATLNTISRLAYLKARISSLC